MIQEENSILKKIISLLLSVTLAVGMNGVPVWAEGSAGSENGIAGHAADDVVFTVSVSVDGSPTEYKEYKQEEDFAQVWKDIQGKTAEIHLLKDLDVGGIDFYIDEDNADAPHSLILTSGKITLTMGEGIRLHDESWGNNGGTDNQLISIKGGTFILDGGIISTIGTALSVRGGSNVYVKNGTLEAKNYYALSVSVWGMDKPNVQIEKCTLKSENQDVILCNGDDLDVNSILANGFAFKNESNEWITSDQKSSLSSKGNFQINKFPVDFTLQPVGETITYGSRPMRLRSQADVTNEIEIGNSIQEGSFFEYQWQQMKDGKWEDITGETDQEFTPSEILPVGSYKYRCKATYDWFFLYSDEAVIIIQPKTVKASIGGKISKGYDGNKDVIPDSLKLLSVTLDEVVPPDIVSGSAVRGEYESEKPGKCKVTVEIELVGNKEGWYKNYNGVHGSSDSSNKAYLTCSVDGEIIGVLLNDHTLEMSAGTAQKLKYDIWLGDSSNPKVSWVSSNPEVATVDESGTVKAVSAGKTVITVIAEDGKYKDFCTVTVSGNGGSFGSPSTNVRLPFLKDRPYKRGWSIIQAEAEKAATEPGSGPAYIGIDMNGTVLVPGRIFTAVKNKDVTLAFDMGGGISWSVCGKDITAETVSDTNLSVKAGGGVIPLDVLNRTAGDCAHLELSPAHNGPFGFTAALTIQTGKNENSIAIGAGDKAAFAGMYANLYAYNTSLRSLEFVCAEQVGEDGIVHLPVDRASDFTVILSADPMGGTDTPEDPSGGQNEIEPEPENLPVGSVELSKTLYTYSGKAKKPAVTAVDTAGMQIPDKYYTVSYQNNIKVGKAAAVIVFKDGYSGMVEKAFTIRPAGTSIKKAAAVSGGFTLKWTKRTTQTSGYQIQYTRNSGFKGSSTKRVNVKKVSVTKKTIKKLKTGKKYYVRIRTYKKVKIDGTNKRVYSAWSRAAALRVK